MISEFRTPFYSGRLIIFNGERVRGPGDGAALDNLDELRLQGFVPRGREWVVGGALISIPNFDL